VELAAMSSLVALVTLDRLNKTTIWSIFGVLACLQILGNCYSSFIYLSVDALTNMRLLLGLEITEIWIRRITAFLTGGILPIISLAFVKGVVEYFRE
jgi:hypothetical protein